MGGWIKWEKDLAADPRVLRMARNLEKRLGNALVTPPRYSSEIHVTLVCGALARLWAYADTHIRADDVLEVGTGELERIVGVPFFAEICPPDWLEVVDDETVKLPAYQEHNGTQARKKAMTQKRVQRHRYGHVKGGNAVVTLDALPDQDQDQDQDLTTPPIGSPVAKPDKPARRPRASRRCPDDFEVTDELRAWATREHPDVDIGRETEFFRDHEFTKPRSDWTASWRNWIRRAATIREAARGASRRRGPPVAEDFTGKRYEGTDDADLPDWAREAVDG